MSPTTPIPIVLVGLRTEVGGPVAEALRPEFDVVRFIQTFPAAQAEIPYLVRGEEPPEAAVNEVGSADFSHGPARAVVLGRGFSQKEGEELHNANKTEGVAFFVSDESKRPVDFENPPPGIEKIMAPAYKELLMKWVKDGKKGGVVYF